MRTLPRVLIVEDEAPIAELIAVNLRHNGFQPTWAMDSETAQRELKAAQQQAGYEAMSEKQLTREVKRLEKEMAKCAQNLEFEEAAKVRDQLQQLRALFIAAS